MKPSAVVAIALLSSLLGGMVVRYATPTPASAQAGPLKEIRAQSLVLVDPQDHAVGTFVCERLDWRQLSTITPSVDGVTITAVTQPPAGCGGKIVLLSP